MDSDQIRPLEFSLGSTFDFRGAPVSTLDLIGSTLVKKIERRFVVDEGLEVDTLRKAVKETLRFIILSLKKGRLFFVGNRLMDEIWHTMVKESLEYRKLCHRIAPDRLLDHSGLHIAEYAGEISEAGVREEQLQWLADYYDAFGEIEEYAFEELFSVRSLSSYLGTTRSQLNDFARGLNEKVRQSDGKSFDETLSAADAEIVSSDRTASVALVQALHRSLPDVGGDLVLPSLSQLEKVYRLSAGLGFMYWQHCAATQRLNACREWQSSNPELWLKIKSGRSMIGLATTHLAKEKQPLSAHTGSCDEVILNGTAPWLSGYGAFSFFVVGFKFDGKNRFAVLPMSQEYFQLPQTNGLKFTPIKLTSLNGTSSVSLQFSNFKIDRVSVLDSSPKSDPPIYLLPELGIVDRALGVAKMQMEVDSFGGISTAVFDSLCDRLSLLRKDRDTYLQGLNLNSSRSEEVELDLSLRRDDLLRRSCDLMVLASGGGALAYPSTVARTLVERTLPWLIPGSSDYFKAAYERVLA